MTLLELSRPLPAGFPRPTYPRHWPHHGVSDSAARTGIGPGAAPYRVVEELTLLERPRSIGPVLMVLAMLASAGAGASLTWAVMDYQPRRPTAVAVAPQPSAERTATGSLAPHEETAVPHDVWAPFVTTIPSVGLRPPVENKPPERKPVELTSLGTPSMIPSSSNSSGIRSWRYQLQGIDPAAVARAPDDLVVVDYAGSRGPFSRADVERMRRKPDGSRRVVLAYLSIGEAEDYRFYWKSEWNKHPPGWLGHENQKWKKNYAVHFWEPEWQGIIFDYLDRIVAAGFDGIYLDRVDQFEQLGHADAMVDFVAHVAERGKAGRPGFMVVSQNGDALLPKKKFRDAIDGFAREDLFYGEDRDGVRNKPDSIRASIRRLKLLATEKKPVFVVEYPHNAAQGETARREIAEAGFIGLIAPRQLDRL